MRPLLAALLLVVASGCASLPGERDPRDPWEAYNRPVHEFNDGVDKAILKPIATGYQKVTPTFVQTGVNNFYGNLQDLGTGLNNILQGKVKEGASDLGRLAVNSVIGIFGFWDVATPMGLEKHNEDFGQTLGWWGVPSGPYFVIPLLGPSTARDAPARYIDPQYFWGRYIDDEATGWILLGVDVVRSRANLLKAGSILEQATLTEGDSYTFVRDAWLQRRRSMVYDGKPPKDPNYDY
ncbi:MlaA family lipoprotein [Usitatibacter palustris]|uniref:Intermembrane phospholipid transport system lipoprotein MlaA n=1 Tax=Usitatibacter palustris TaxID=2732487 RepID=A0A6M4H9I5_9PROT|nr:VacJ family lipoprotein [Usitatibacter palustris]QJR15383.1 Intermembrane phospholipid transport system lipoprotein MlaA [Usitatibacter palustris]